MRRYLPARLLAKDSIISVLSKIKGPGVLPIVNDTSPGIPAFITLDEALDLGEVKRRKSFPEKEVILDALRTTKGNKKKAAELLDIARPLLYQKIRRLGML